MKKLMTLFLLASCAHETPLQTYLSSVSEVKKDETSFYVLKDYAPKSRSRSISSIHVESETNNKELYFTTLYHQYKKIASLSKKADEIKSCPAFHQTWLGFNKGSTHSSLNLPYSYKEVIKNNHSLASFPELGLETEEGKKVIDYVHSERKLQADTIISALKNYNEKNYNELLELCDKGVSANYFVFENMTAFYSKEEAFHKSGKALISFLKMPIVSNSLIIDRFTSSTDVFTEISYRNEALGRLGAGWFENYLYDLKNLRQNLSNITFNEAGNK